MMLFGDAFPQAAVFWVAFRDADAQAAVLALIGKLWEGDGQTSFLI